MNFVKASDLLFYYDRLPIGKIFFKFLKMCDSDQRGSQTLLPGGQTATKCEIIYFILIIFKDFFILRNYTTLRNCCALAQCRVLD